MQKRLIVKALILISLIGCTDEPKEINFEVGVKNESNQPIEVEAFEKGISIYQLNLNHGQKGPKCNYVDEKFRGMLYNYCGIDSLTIKFNNGLGYISTSNNLPEYSFSNKKNPLLPNRGFKINGNSYEFIISQEDFDNAHILPQ